MADDKNKDITTINNIGHIQKRSIVDEMQESYLDYAMSVIVARALPDARDGLKPVQRRILYAMQTMGLHATGKHRKSATVVGETLGRYHPHGDMAVYDALVRMAQEFSLRYPLIDGQGNFGSIDGDAAAAQRYTEVKMTRLSEEMMADIDKDTVDWVDNYDATRQEPGVLPTKVPQLLLNGSIGIAVGMATNIPPHNLTEMVDAMSYLIDNAKATSQDLCQFIKGPDFPTGGAIYDRENIIQTYSTGRGGIVTRAQTEIAEKKAGQFQIIISEIPYAVNKSNLIIKIADLVKDKKIEGIRDIRDESDKDGIRIVIELKSDVQPQKILNRLFKLTDLQKTFHVNILALLDGIQPQTLSLREALDEFLKHRQSVVVRRTKFDLNQAKERAHILIGLVKALDHINEVIETIKKSKNKEEAHANLMKKFKLSDRQSAAILEMKLQTLAGLERQKIKDELEEKKKLIAYLEDLLASPKKILGVIKKELTELKEKYGDERKTRVYSEKVGEFKEEELVPKEECIIILTSGGYIKRVNPKAYKSQKRGGKGIIGITPRDEDVVGHFLPALTHDSVLFFTDKGRVFRTKAYEIPEASRTARGQALVNILQLEASEKVTAVVNIKKKEEMKYLFMATQNGVVKRTSLEEFENVRRSGLIAIKLNKGDNLKWARLTSGKDEIILISAKGQCIRFKETDVRVMGRAASGVRGIRLKSGDYAVGMDMIIAKEAKILVVAENGFGKKAELRYYKIQRRGGSGIKTAKVTAKTGLIISAQIIGDEQEDLIAISQKGQVVKTKLKDVSSLGRVTQGVRIMKLNKGDKLASIAVL